MKESNNLEKYFRIHPLRPAVSLLDSCACRKGLWEYQEIVSICDILHVPGASETSTKCVGTLLIKTRVSFLSVFIVYVMHLIMSVTQLCVSCILHLCSVDWAGVMEL